MDYKETFDERHALVRNLFGKKNLVKTAEVCVNTEDIFALSSRGINGDVYAELLAASDVLREGRLAKMKELIELREARARGRMIMPASWKHRREIAWDFNSIDTLRNIKETIHDIRTRSWLREPHNIKGIPEYVFYKDKVYKKENDRLVALNWIENTKEGHRLDYNTKEVIINNKKYTKKFIFSNVLYPLYEFAEKDRAVVIKTTGEFTITELFNIFSEQKVDFLNILRGNAFFIIKDGITYRPECEQLLAASLINDLRWLFVLSNKDNRTYYGQQARFMRCYFGIDSTDEIVAEKSEVKRVKDCYDFIVKRHFEKDISEWVYNASPYQNKNNTIKRLNCSATTYIQYIIYGVPKEIANEYFWKIINRIKEKRIKRK